MAPLSAWVSAVIVLASAVVAEMPFPVPEQEPELGLEHYITAAEAQIAAQAWTKLEEQRHKETRYTHSIRRRDAASTEATHSRAAEIAAAAAETAARTAALKAVAERRSVTEFTLTSESSFTAVSNALDRLANFTRVNSTPVATEFLVEGNVDAETIQNYLRSPAASAMLAKAEEDALRKVVGILLTASAAATTAVSSTSAPRFKSRRQARDVLDHSLAAPQPIELPSASTEKGLDFAPRPDHEEIFRRLFKSWKNRDYVYGRNGSPIPIQCSHPQAGPAK